MCTVSRVAQPFRVGTHATRVSGRGVHVRATRVRGHLDVKVPDVRKMGALPHPPSMKAAMQALRRPTRRFLKQLCCPGCPPATCDVSVWCVGCVVCDGVRAKHDVLHMQDVLVQGVARVNPTEPQTNATPHLKNTFPGTAVLRRIGGWKGVVRARAPHERKLCTHDGTRLQHGESGMSREPKGVRRSCVRVLG